MRPGLERRIGWHHDAEGIARDVEHVADVLDRIPVDLGGVGQAEHAQRNLRQRVAVGLGCLQRLRGQRATGAGLVLDDHGLAEDLAGVVGQHAHGDIGGTACGEGNHELDRLGGKALGAGGTQRDGGECGCAPLNDVSTLHVAILKGLKVPLNRK